MEEVKIRLDALNYALSANVALPPQIIRECCFLQLRLLCELIALGCLVAHGDIEATTRLRKEYAAGRIIEQLEKLHPEFYPWPLTQHTSGTKHDLKGVTTGFLSKPDLLTLYALCGDILHRGTLKKLLSKVTTIPHDHKDIIEWGQKIQNLLAYHGFLLFNKDTIMLCMLRSADDNNRVQIGFGERITP